METKEDYAAAASRHLIDARLLAAESRWDNALYLSGYTAECSLKAVVERAGIGARGFSHKLNDLHGPALELAATMAPATARYRPPDLAVEWFSTNWQPSLRYSPDIASDRVVLEAVTEAGRIFDSTIAAMRLDGLLPWT
ncbi:MAG TPA: hypothetical protein VGS22_00055 [Thermoanaerobaculia bacterium]|jgi:HEPN domain-containing protein|nr:hypothetical protein [Thermoanaerobaculia bacterium]